VIDDGITENKELRLRMIRSYCRYTLWNRKKV